MNALEITDCGSNGWLSLHFAAEHDSIDVIIVLLALGVPVNAVALKHRSKLHTPLQVACSKGSLRATALLLGASADPNLHPLASKTAVHLVCMKGFGEIVKVLLKFGAHPSIKIERRPPMLSAALNHHLDMLDMLSDHITRSLTEYEQTMAILALIANEALGVWRFLLDLIPITAEYVAFYWPHPVVALCDETNT